MTFHNRSRVTLLALTTLLAGCNDKQAYQPLPPAEVRITQPVQRNVTRYLEMTGQTAAAKTVDLVARVQGTLTEIRYKDGAAVKQGERDFTALATTDFEFELYSSGEYSRKLERQWMD